MAGPLLLLAPIEPRRTGNGLAMRVASFAEAARRQFFVHVVVVPVTGTVPGRSGRLDLPVVTVPPRSPGELLGPLAGLLADKGWRSLLAEVEPMPALARLASPALADEVVAAAGAAPGTPVHVMRSYLAPLALAVAGRLAAPWVSLDLDDDDERAHRPANPGEADAYGRLVGAVVARCSALSAASPEEAAAITARHGAPCLVVPNTVALPPVQPGGGSGRRPGSPAGGGGSGSTARILFVGNLTYGPNLEAACWLVEEILPAIRARHRGPVEAVLVGPYHPGSPLGRLGEREGVELAGFVEDLAPFYARAGVVLAPLRSGAGTRTKLLEAFANEVPVVTTPIGAAGLTVRDGRHLLLGAGTDELAEQAARLLADPARAVKLAAAALELVRSSYSPATAAASVARLFATARLNGRPEG